MNRSKGSLTGLGLIAGALFTGGMLASGSGLAADDAALEQLAAARERWQAARPRDYVYGYHKHCDCYRELPPETVITVMDGYVERVFHLHDDSEREVPAREGSLGLYWTIEDLFAKIEAALATEAIVRASYDPALGYPTTLYIDYDPTIPGDETDLRLTRVEIL